MARRLSSRLSVTTLLGLALACSQACAASSNNGGGGSGDDSGAPLDDGGGADSTVSDSSARDSAVGETATGDVGGDARDTASGDSALGDVGSDVPPPADGAVCAPAACGADTDCDGITDLIEGRFATPPTDTDKDGKPDYLDDDSDDDGILDHVEWVTPGCDSPLAEKNDADGNGVPNFQSLDSDGNGLPDHDEACPPATMPGAPAGCSRAAPADFDGDGWMDFIDFDNDHDSSKASLTIGLDDKTELSDNAKKYVGITIDTDGDKIPDVWDRDSDNDNVFDLEDGTSDPNGNGAPNFRDTDSDGDKVPDACEARANKDFTPSYAEAAKPLVDTNGDGILDFLELDSDGDFLGDGKEDKNGNCVVDTDETDRIKYDSAPHSPSVPDLVSVALGGAACAKDPSCTPGSLGKFYFIVPYAADGSLKPTPADGTLALSTKLQKGDVGFIVDTTISMDGEIAALRTDLSTKIIPGLAAKFTDLGIGVAAHDDFPSASITNYSATSRPFYVAPKGAPTGYVSTDPTQAQTAANSLVTSSGGDIPESQIAAMMRALDATQVLSNSDATPFTLAAETPPAGTFGSLRFRSDALPIVIPITDSGFHNARRALTAPPTGAAGDYDWALQNAYPSAVSSPNVDDLVGKITALGAKVIGISADNGSRSTALNQPYGFEAYLADKTGSYVPKTAFPGVPASCKTNIGGTSTAADGPVVAGVPTCRLTFSINTDGSGLSDSIIRGVGALLNAITFDVHVRAYKNAADAIDSVDAFIDELPPQPTGGTDPTTGGVCVTFPATALADKYTGPKAFSGSDGKDETITGLNPGKLYCFKVVPKPNTTVAPTTDPQTFTAWLSVVADAPGGSFTLGSDRQVLFIVPPRLN